MLVVIDTGGTKTLVASFNKSGKLGTQVKFPTPQDSKEYTELLKSTLKNTFTDQSVDAIVIAIPGILKNGAVVWCPNLPKWAGYNVVKALSGVLGDAPILIENDAKLAGLYETRILSKIPPQCLYVTISTGIGTGIITNGHIDPSLHHSEGGRALIEFDGVMREWQHFASGKSFYETYGKFVRDITSKRIWNQIADRISRGFLVLIPILQPDVIVIGGSVGTYFERYGEQLQKILVEKLPPYIPCPKFVQAVNSELAVIYGCYYYAIDNLITITPKK
jgi:predicted NBD/HSP70 family sugar kinase